MIVALLIETKLMYRRLSSLRGLRSSKTMES